MRDPLRIKRILDQIEILWKQYPDWRLGQLLVNAGDLISAEVFYVEDDAIEIGIKNYIKQIESRNA